MALVRTRYGWQDDSQAASIDWGRPEAEMAADRDRERKIQAGQDESRVQEVTGGLERTSKEGIATKANESAERRARIQADAMIEAEKIRAGFAKGGPVKDPRATRRMYAKGGAIFR